VDAEGAVRAALGEAYLADGPFGEVGSRQAYFSFDRRGEPAGSFECSLDGARFSACTSPQGYSDLSEGVHRFRVRARDAQGLPLESTPVRRAWTVDNTVPQTPTISGPSRTVVNAVERTVFVQGTAEPDGFVDVYQDDHMMFRTRSDDRGNWASRIGVDGNDGEYSYRVGSADMAGNTSDLSSPFSVKVDATTPSVIATSPEGGATGVPTLRDVRLSFSEPMDETTENSNTITVAMEGSKETATVSYDAAGRSATLDPERGLVSGATYTLTVKTGVRDLAGNPLAAEESRTFTVGQSLTQRWPPARKARSTPTMPPSGFLRTKRALPSNAGCSAPVSQSP
jgi:large repetitive protein